MKAIFWKQLLYERKLFMTAKTEKMVLPPNGTVPRRKRKTEGQFLKHSLVCASSLVAEIN